MTYIEIDEKILKEVKKLTITDYEVKGNLLPTESVVPMIEDLLWEINSLKEKLDDTETQLDYAVNGY